MKNLCFNKYQQYLYAQHFILAKNHKPCLNVQVQTNLPRGWQLIDQLDSHLYSVNMTAPQNLDHLKTHGIANVLSPLASLHDNKVGKEKQR